MNVLVIGANGQLGGALMRVLKTDFDVIGTYVVDEPDELVHLDITDNDEINKVLDEVKPNIVINTAALTHVDRCEEKNLHIT